VNNTPDNAVGSIWRWGLSVQELFEEFAEKLSQLWPLRFSGNWVICLLASINGRLDVKAEEPFKYQLTTQS